MTFIPGTLSNDTLAGTAGDDSFDGLAGVDAVDLGGPSGAVTLGLDAEGRWLVTSAAGTDTLVSIERLQASDGALTLGQSETLANLTTFADDGYEPLVAALPDGGYMVMWTSWLTDFSAMLTYGQRYSVDGVPMGGETEVDPNSFNPPPGTSATLADGSTVTAWYSYNDGGVYSQRTDANGNVVGSGATLQGDAGNNTVRFEGTQAVHLVGMDGNDSLGGGAGNDVLDGGAGDDTAIAGDAASALSFVFSAGGVSISGAQGGTDRLVSIEHVQTSSGTVDVKFAAAADTRVNTYTGNDQFNANVAALAGGGYVLTWQSFGQDGGSYGVYAQRYGADGSAQGAETRVNTTVGSSQNSPAVAALAGGGYVVTWTSSGQDNGVSAGVYAQRFDAGGNALGGETLVNTTLANDQSASRVAALSNGGYVITWTSALQDGSGNGVYAQRFDANGNTVGAETGVNSTTAGDQNAAAAVALAGGGYVLAWTSNLQDGGGWGVYAQRFDANGNAAGGEVRINTATAGDQFQPALAALAGGGYMATWTSASQDGSGNGVFAQRYDASGNAVGAQAQVNTTSAGHQQQPTVAGLADGGWVVAWQSAGQDGSGDGVYAQRYAADGSAVGGETLVNTTTVSDQGAPTVAALAEGGYVIGWQDWGQDGSFTGVYSARFDAYGLRAGHPTLTGDGADNVIRASSSESVEIHGGAGNDTLAGSAGKDVLTGGSGADSFEFAASGNGVDRITDFGAGDRITVAGASFAADPTAGDGSGVGLNQVQVSAANGITRLCIGTDATPGADVVVELNGTFPADQLWSMGGNAITLASAGLNLTGTSANDNLAGGVGNDTINGGAGSDTMAGGLRNDTYIVDNKGDVVLEAANAGTDQVQSSVNHTLAANVENLVLTGANAINGTGNAGANVITGNGAANVLTGDLGADTLAGGAGADKFAYNDTADSTVGACDVITDFVSGVDRIDVSKIDANPTQGGNQAFTFIGGAAFGANATGQMRFDSAAHMLYGSTNADATPEIAIQLNGVNALNAADIVL